jgi:hypothetical protein
MSILRADSIRDRAGTGAPDFPNGLTGTLTGTATTATTLSGTPNITVGTVTGTDATFSGNLTVNGTTTTIDTAVTAVDSLSVDGSIGIGTTNPVTKLVVASSDSGHADMRFQNSTTGYLTNNGFWVGINNNENALIYNYHNSDLLFATNSAVRLGITSTGTAIFKAGLAEKFNNTGTTMSSGTHAIQSGNIIRFTGNESGANALNITGIHSTLANGEALSFTVICTPNGSGYISGFNIDGVAPATAIKWSGGSAPSASSSGQDVYTFTVLKIGTATNAYEVYGAMTNYA